MRELPILFSGEMVRALLDGRKTQTRRIVKPQPKMFIKLCEEGVFYGTDLVKWDRIEGNTELAKQRLYGRSGRQYLLKDAFCGIWEKGIHGLVSLSGVQNEKGLSFGFYMPPKQKEDSICASVNMCSVSREKETQYASQALRRQSDKQYSREFKMGDSKRELVGQEKTRNCDYRGEASYVKTEQQATTRNKAISERREEPKGDCQNLRNIASCDLECIKQNCYSVGQILYVRETWKCVKYDSTDGDLSYGVEFKDGVRQYFEFDDNERFHQFGKFAFKDGWQPSMFMPKEAARIWLEVTNVRVERLQEITEEDAIKEGVRIGIGGMPYFSCRDAFPALWDSTIKNQDLPLYGWDANPWVWVIEFKRLEVRP